MEMDLNVADGVPDKPAATARSDSGMSESSVLNAEASGTAPTPAEEGSSSTPLPPAVLEFSILRSSASAEGENDVGDEEDATPSPPPHQQLVTQELFPADAAPPRPAPQHWAELGFVCPEPPRPQPDNRVVPHAPPLAPLRPPQAAKKSRRGPRSRSSQYRGVTSEEERQYRQYKKINPDARAKWGAQRREEGKKKQRRRLGSQVQECYEIAAEYEGEHDSEKLR
ncbi:hypothetical protein GUJ93_ZPchr0007g6298 [Zizania palustris]|uniref:Uncharacterized protein n=1 Tax=Zizania palustris TaxID=103762 RepID=A0A8J5TF17_ZIZPA|nr:hypothetical protein GUJ93_ZPchr0007g6298 [Zizania palustris]